MPTEIEQLARIARRRPLLAAVAFVAVLVLLAALVLLSSEAAEHDEPLGQGPSGLQVRAGTTMAGYDRSLFGPAWTDGASGVALAGNGCDTRNDILARDLQRPRVNRDCAVMAGTLQDPYTGETISFRRGKATSSRVQIDHVVALGAAWRTGAQELGAADRVRLANDPRNLLAVDGPTNAAKGDKDAASWLPPLASYRCAYVQRQIEVKKAYRLWVTPAEASAMNRVLRTC